MLKLWCGPGLKISELPQKSGQLDQDHKDLVIIWVVPVDEALESAVVLGHRVILELLQELPVLCQLMLGLGII